MLSERFTQNTNMMRALPALMLCFVTLTMLVLDITVPAMVERQYLVYPLLIRIAGLLSAVCAAACFISDINNDRLRLNAVVISFGLFAVWITASTLINGITTDALFGLSYRYVGACDMLLFMAVYMYCSAGTDKERTRKAVLDILVVTADLAAAAFLYNELIGEIEAFQDRMEPAGMFFHGNHYGYFLVIVIAVSAGWMLFGDKGRLCFGGASLLVNLAALALNRTMGAFVAICLTIFIMLVWTCIRGEPREKKRTLYITAAGCIMVSAVIVFADGFRRDLIEIAAEFAGIVSGNNNIYAGNGRWGIWQYVIGLIAEKPVFGWGCEGISEDLKAYALTASPHNEPLTYAAYYGIPGALFYVIGVAVSVARGIGAGRECAACRVAAFAALAYFISSLFGTIMFYTVPFMFVMLGLSCSRTDV